MLESNTCGKRPNATSEALCHFWHPVARSEEVTDKPIKVKLLDQPLVLWRSNGRVAAFYDLCVHRGTPLSLGWLDNGELVCAYHGWRYGADGSCTRIPSLPADRAIPAQSARQFVQSGGALRTHMGVLGSTSDRHPGVPAGVP